MEEAGNLLYRLPKGAPACGSHIKNVQHKEQITPANIFYIMIPSLRVGDYIMLHIENVAVYISLKNDDRTRLSPAYFVFG